MKGGKHEHIVVFEDMEDRNLIGNSSEVSNIHKSSKFSNLQNSKSPQIPFVGNRARALWHYGHIGALLFFKVLKKFTSILKLLFVLNFNSFEEIAYEPGK